MGFGMVHLYTWYTFARVKDEFSCRNDTCVACGLCTLIQESLPAPVLKLADEGHLGIVKLKQHCRDRVLVARHQR